MHIVTFLVVGLFVGFVASFLLDGHGLGPFGDTIVGIIGAFVGGFAVNIFGIAAYGFWDSIAASVIGAMVFLYAIRLFSGFRRSKGPTVKSNN